MLSKWARKRLWSVVRCFSKHPLAYYATTVSGVAVASRAGLWSGHCSLNDDESKGFLCPVGFSRYIRGTHPSGGQGSRESSCKSVFLSSPLSSSRCLCICWQQETHRVMWLIWFFFSPIQLSFRIDSLAIGDNCNRKRSETGRWCRFTVSPLALFSETKQLFISLVYDICPDVKSTPIPPWDCSHKPPPVLTPLMHSL